MPFAPPVTSARRWSSTFIASACIVLECVDPPRGAQAAKPLGQLLWRLWGGYRSRLPMIAIGGYYDAKADLSTEVTELLELGVGGMKLKVGGLDPDADAVRARTVRETAGDGFILAADANQAWTPREAIRFARLVEDLGLVWLEEPCRGHNDLRPLRDVRYAAGARICAGQHECS